MTLPHLDAVAQRLAGDRRGARGRDLYDAAGLDLDVLAGQHFDEGAAAPDILAIAEQGLPQYDVAGWFAAVGAATLSAAEVKRNSSVTLD